MSTQLLIPFAAASAPECQALLSGLALPNLQALLPRLAEQPADRGDDHSLSPPHERALARALGLPVADGAIPWAAAQSDAPTAPQAWFSLCHYQVATGQVNLLPGAQLGLDAADSRALFDAFAPLCAEDGIALRWDSATEWHASGEPLRGIACASLDRVSGRQVGDWMPQSPANPTGARLLQRLQSEAQMLFYSHPVHDARRARATRGQRVLGARRGRARRIAHPAGTARHARRPAPGRAARRLACVDRGLAGAGQHRHRGAAGRRTARRACHAHPLRRTPSPQLDHRPSSAFARLGRSIKSLFGTAPIGDTLKDL